MRRGGPVAQQGKRNDKKVTSNYGEYQERRRIPPEIKSTCWPSHVDEGKKGKRHLHLW